MTIMCAGCGGPIIDRTLLSAMDRFWHIACLNCSCCGLRLDELGSSVFVRSNMLLCRQDYIKLFGLTGTCAKCRTPIPPDEFVMRCQDRVYHVNCFSCVQCQNLLHPGDKICSVGGNLFCEHEFPYLFSGNVKLPSSLKFSSAAAAARSSSPCVSNDYEMSGRAPPMESMGNSKVKSANFGPLDQAQPLSQHQQQQQQLNGHASVKMNPHQQSDVMMSSISPHPNSPSMAFVSSMANSGGGSGSSGNNTTNSNMMLGPNDGTSVLYHPGFYPSEMDKSFADPNVTNPPALPEKTTKSNITTSSTGETTGGRKKQKKVDNRRCPPLRVC